MALSKTIRRDDLVSYLRHDVAALMEGDTATGAAAMAIGRWLDVVIGEIESGRFDEIVAIYAREEARSQRPRRDVEEERERRLFAGTEFEIP